MTFAAKRRCMPCRSSRIWSHLKVWRHPWTKYEFSLHWKHICFGEKRGNLKVSWCPLFTSTCQIVFQRFSVKWSKFRLDAPVSPSRAAPPVSLWKLGWLPLLPTCTVSSFPVTKTGYSSRPKLWISYLMGARAIPVTKVLKVVEKTVQVPQERAKDHPVSPQNNCNHETFTSKLSKSFCWKKQLNIIKCGSQTKVQNVNRLSQKRSAWSRAVPQPHIFYRQRQSLLSQQITRLPSLHHAVKLFLSFTAGPTSFWSNSCRTTDDSPCNVWLNTHWKVRYVCSKAAVSSSRSCRILKYDRINIAFVSKQMPFWCTPPSHTHTKETTETRMRPVKNRTRRKGREGEHGWNVGVCVAGDMGGALILLRSCFWFWWAHLLAARLEFIFDGGQAIRILVNLLQYGRLARKQTNRFQEIVLDVLSDIIHVTWRHSRFVSWEFGSFLFPFEALAVLLLHFATCHEKNANHCTFWGPFAKQTESRVWVWNKQNDIHSVSLEEERELKTQAANMTCHTKLGMFPSAAIAQHRLAPKNESVQK